MGRAYYPDAFGIAVSHTHNAVGNVPILATENGIAAQDDGRRIAYTSEALQYETSFLVLLDQRSMWGDYIISG